MLIVSAGTPDYQPMMDECRHRVKVWGYGYVAYPLEHSGDLEGVMPPCTFKPGIIGQALANADSGEPMAWLDADAIPIRSLAPLESIEFDVAVTLRSSAEIGTTNPITNYLNAGVAFFRNTFAAREFVDLWAAETARCGNDQLALNRMVGRGWADDDWRNSFHCSARAENGATVHILPAAEWNCWTFPVPPEARILHFKRGFRAAGGPGWWRRVLENA